MGGANEKILDRRTDVVLLTYQNTVARFTSIRFSSTPDDLIKAVNSIPAYIEHATHFFVVSPDVPHCELPGVVCGYSSWLNRGWW